MNWLNPINIFGAVGYLEQKFINRDDVTINSPCFMPVIPLPGGPCIDRSVIDFFVPGSKDWKTPNFIAHYVGRSGSAVNLEDVGLLDDFQNSDSARKIQNLWETSVKEKTNQVVSDLLAQGGDTPRTVTLHMEEGFRYNVAKNRWDITNPLYSVAGGYLNATADCTIQYDPKTKTVSWTADLTYKETDAFKEPLDIPGLEVGGKPYDIIIEWSQRLTG